MKTTLLLEQHLAPDGSPWGRARLVRALLRLEATPRADDRRVPLNLSLVLDRSGSMADGRLEAACDAAADLVRRLHPDDRVSVVAFDDEVTTVAPPATAAENPGTVDAIRGIALGGSTNLSGGWLAGRAHVGRHCDANGVNRVILLTDGHANAGITDHDRLVALCRDAQTRGVSTTTVGIGEGFDEDLLTAMADAGGGSHYYVESLDQTGELFAEELDGLLGIAAQNVTVTLKPRDAVSVTAVHHGYTAQPLANGALQLMVGDLYAREPREVLVDLLVPDDALQVLPTRGVQGVAILDLDIEADTWRDDGGMERRHIAMPVTFDAAEGPVTHPEVTRVHTLLQAARARREAREQGDAGDTCGAAQSLRNAARLMRHACPGDATIAEDAADLERTADSMEDEAFMSTMDRKYLIASERHASRGRREALRKSRRGGR